MKIVVRSFALALMVAGLIATCRTQATHAASILEYKSAQERMPIPVCPPNDPEACHIEKW
jgi:hypothetical protein